MATKKQQGFTIIEVMLFVALTGALLIGLLAGTSVMIQRQRYSDSINSTQAFFQGQYNQVTNVLNDRSGAEVCSGDDNFVEPAGGASAEAPGASRCVVLGKAIDVPSPSSQQELASYAVVGSEPTGTVDPDITDDELMRLYRPSLVRLVGASTYDIPWGTTVVGFQQEGPERTPVNRLLLLRSPKSGAIYTYSYNSTSSDSSVLPGVERGNRENTVNVCLQSADILSAVSTVSIAMSGGPEAVATHFDINDRTERCGL